MQPSIDLFARQIAMIERIIWTLTFAAQLVLLVVMMGRDRARRFPWFTAGIALLTLRMMAEVLLTGRMAKLPLHEFLITLADLAVIVGLLVLAEMARSAFAGIQRSVWIVNTAGLLLVAGGLLAMFEPWPVWKNIPLDTLLGKLLAMQYAAHMGDVLVALLTVGLGVLVVVFGRHYKAGWRSHTQMIVIGLFALAVTYLTWEAVILRTLHYTQAQSDSVMRLRLSFAFARQLMSLAAQVWWIVWLWKNEPGAAADRAGA